MEKEGYAAVASTYRETFCENLYFGNCNLTKENLTYFKDRCVAEGVTVRFFRFVTASAVGFIGSTLGFNQ